MCWPNYLQVCRCHSHFSLLVYALKRRVSGALIPHPSPRAQCGTPGIYLCGPEPLDVEKQEVPGRPSEAVETRAVILEPLPSFRVTVPCG